MYYGATGADSSEPGALSLVQGECTTAPQAQIAASPGAEPSEGRMYYGATGADSSESGR